MDKPIVSGIKRRGAAIGCPYCPGSIRRGDAGASPFGRLIGYTHVGGDPVPQDINRVVAPARVPIEQAAMMFHAISQKVG